MSETAVRFPPGVNTQKTQASNAGAFSESNLVRWRTGLLERIGGWQRLFDDRCDDHVRAIHAYQDLQNENTLLLGTDAGTQIYTENSGLVDTRLGRRRALLSPPIYTAPAASPAITITDATHGANNGDLVRLPYALCGDTDNALFTQISAAQNYFSGIYSHGLYIMGGFASSASASDGLSTSPDALVWTPRVAAASARMYRMASDGTSIVASTNTGSGLVFRSLNGTSWTTVGTGFGQPTFGCGVGGGAFIVWTTPNTSGFGRFLRSTNGGASWSLLAGGPQLIVLDIKHNGSYFMAVGESGVFQRSTDGGVSWSTVFSPGGSSMQSLAWSPSLQRWIAVGNNGRIFRSNDSTGTTWTQMSSPTGLDLYSVAWTGTQFVACGVNVALCSLDGQVWFAMVPRALSAYTGIAAGPDYTVIGGTTGGTLERIRRTSQPPGSSVSDLPAATYPISDATTNTYTIQAPVPGSTATLTGGWPRLYACCLPGLSPSTRVRVFEAGHGRTAGSTFTPDIDVALASNSVELDAGTQYTVASVPNAWSFDIETSQTPATVLAEAIYENGSATPVAQLQYFRQVLRQPRNWFLDNFGQYGVFVPENGAVYIYTPPVPENGIVLAEIVETAPQINAGMFVPMPQAQIMCFGSEATIGGGVQDPLLVRWSDAGDYTVWAASATNQAGSFRLSRGSLIVGGIQAPQSGLLWTDIDLWSVQYIGPPLVYGFQMIGSGCGLVAPKARTVQGRNTYWMSRRGFFVFGDSGVQPLPCSVRDVVFDDLDYTQINKVHAGSNSSASEVMWFYPSVSGGTGEIDSYVKYNTVEQCWDYGRLCRTSWYDDSVWGTAIGADENFRIQQHEQGFDADGQPMEGAYVQSGYARIKDGATLAFVSQMMPDLKFIGDGAEDGSVTLTIFTKITPNSMPQMHGPFSATTETERIPMRARARHIALRLEWAPALEYNARLGETLLDIAPSGRAP